MRKKKLTLGDSQPNFENARPLSPTRDSRPERTCPGEECELLVVVRIRFSKMAMTMNIEMRMAVAIKPKETALTGSLNWDPHFPSCRIFVGAPTGGHWWFWYSDVVLKLCSSLMLFVLVVVLVFLVSCIHCILFLAQPWQKKGERGSNYERWVGDKVRECESFKVFKIFLSEL